ncbi:M24 family metallopeptidase [Pelodictyon phaeoclathratiforme]|jgi:Xaa-Pro aminopeptidase|uniref:Peptidase M24 n=1 Tax=Pelodictyon phaeoclathratiforme (strain DSM 5477 / BU-1) TaxID=324925 RepID=B4SFL3_PELPB|nr:Xaa-Pro peptidase family protein [Pelodictyon phaeoclathratiforme]ACF43268.1 peptidase M24 [Pelodictyon phaeoclathratiforme BU-1]MBV5290308.1 aminopeptidase P family protein [Pelodictyon phaeoclathratiforme]
MLTKTESQERVFRLQVMLRSKDIHAALFIMPIDVYYFAGTRQNAILWIPAEGEPLLLVRKSLSRAMDESPIAAIRPFPSSKEFASVFSEDLSTIGMTFDAIPVQQHLFYSRALPGRTFVDISMMLRELRSVKSPFELEQLRLSAGKLASVFAEVPQFLKAGMRELDLSAEMEYRLRKAGHEGYVRMRAFNQELFFGLAVSSGGLNGGFFDGPVTGKGLSSASPHGASCDEIRVNQPILLDFGGVFNGYISDMTRMFVIGTLDAELQRAFDVAIEIQELVRRGMKPGAICEELFFAAAAMAEKAGLGSCFMGMPGEQAKFVGHGVGLELDELPVLAKGFTMPLQAGQVIAVEPKFVIPGKGVIGIENTFAVTDDGGLRLSDLPDDIVFLGA